MVSVLKRTAIQAGDALWLASPPYVMMGAVTAMNPRKGGPSSSSPQQKSEVMTVSEVAAYLNCHPRTVYRLLEGGELPAFRLRRDWRFLRSKVDKWIAERQVRPQAPAKPSDKKRKGRRRAR